MAVSGRDSCPADTTWPALCQQLLGFTPPEGAIDGSFLRLSALRTHLDGGVPVDADDAVIASYARSYIMLLIGSYLFIDKSSSKVKLMYLPLLADLTTTGQYSWGSAALAWLYREMCIATRRDTKDIGGLLILLQLWAWEHLSHIRPQRLLPRGPLPHGVADDVHVHPEAGPVDGIAPAPAADVAAHDDLPAGPRGCSWEVAFSAQHTPTHVLRHYRDQLDQMRDEQMIWQPYTADVLSSLPDYCLSGRELWTTRAPLICFDVVEWHFPDRVMRQFGCRQMIPASCDSSRELHATNRRGRHGYDWTVAHQRYIGMWDQRRDFLVHGEPTLDVMDATDPYMEWYRRITRLLIGPPMPRPDIGFQPVGSIIELLEQTVTQVYHTARDTVSGEPDLQKCLAAISEMGDISYKCLAALSEHRRILHHRADVQQPVVAAPVHVRQRGVRILRHPSAPAPGQTSAPVVDIVGTSSEAGPSTAYVPDTTAGCPSTPYAPDTDYIPTPVVPHTATSPLDHPTDTSRSAASVTPFTPLPDPVGTADRAPAQDQTDTSLPEVEPCIPHIVQPMPARPTSPIPYVDYSDDGEVPAEGVTQESSLLHRGRDRGGHGVDHHTHDPVDGGVTQDVPAPPDGQRPKRQRRPPPCGT